MTDLDKELDYQLFVFFGSHAEERGNALALLIRRLQDERDKAKARIEELEKALEPFANEWNWNCAPRQTGGSMDHPDYDRELLDEDHSITYGHLRTAARALKGEK